MIDDVAQRRWWTVAWIDALLIATRQRWEAVVVAGALGSFADFVRITGVSVRTVAPRLVVSISGTQCVDAALREQAGVDAFVVDARLNQRALAVATATESMTILLRISSVAFIADAYRSVHCYVTAAVETARV